jgi:adenylate cyclase
MKGSARKKTASRLYKKWYTLLFVSLLILLAVWFLEKWSFFRGIENRSLDYRFGLFSIEDQTNEDVVLITIDDKSLEFFVQNGISWPWPRDFYAHLIDYFNEVGAEAVLFDILFYEPDIDRHDISGEVTDRRFARAMARYGKAILSSQPLPDSTAVPIQLSNFNYPLKEEIRTILPYFPGIRAPITEFLENAGNIGMIHVSPDEDGVIRSVPLFHRIEQYVLAQFAISALISHDKQKEIERISLRGSNWYFDDTRIPVDEKGRYKINWYGKDGPDGSFQYYPFQAVVQSASATMQGLKPAIPPDAFFGKYIIIGATAPGLRDLVSTPVSQITPGMELWAAILSNFLNHDFIRTVPTHLNLLYYLLLALLLMLIFTRNPIKIGNVLIIFMFLLIILLPLYTWSAFRLEVKMLSPLMVFFLSYMYITTVSYFSEGKAKKEIQKAFGRYLHPDIIDRLVDNPNMIDLKGDEYSATVLFTDIYDFTTFSEKTKPTELVNLLNKYFDGLTGVILDNNGMLDKYTGDGLMAVFGAPLANASHARDACIAALSHKKEWATTTQAAADQEDMSVMFHRKTRIGINSGSIVAGNIGSKRRVDYTVIGDAVNLASRLEGLNKYYSTDIILSDSTYHQIKDFFVCRKLDYLKVKGKNEVTTIYELIDNADEIDSYSWINLYEQGLELYFKGEWDKAMNCFQSLSDSELKDKVAKIMLDRCLYLQQNSPEKWDGVFRWEVK